MQSKSKGEHDPGARNNFSHILKRSDFFLPPLGEVVLAWYAIGMLSQTSLSQLFAYNMDDGCLHGHDPQIQCVCETFDLVGYPEMDLKMQADGKNTLKSMTGPLHMDCIGQASWKQPIFCELRSPAKTCNPEHNEPLI